MELEVVTHHQYPNVDSHLSHVVTQIKKYKNNSCSTFQRNPLSLDSDFGPLWLRMTSVQCFSSGDPLRAMPSRARRESRLVPRVRVVGTVPFPPQDRFD